MSNESEPAIEDTPADATPEPAEPAPPAPEPAPPSAARVAPAADEPAAPGGGAPDTPRAFSGPHGEEMFGVPDPGFTHERLQNELYERARRNAADAFRDLDDTDAEGELDLGDF